MPEFHKRTGWLFVIVVVVQVVLVSAQMQTKSGVRVLSLATFETFSRVQLATSAVVRTVRDTWDSYFALRHMNVENEELRRQVGDLEVRLQQEHALAARSQRLQELMDLKTSSTLPTLARGIKA